MDIGTFPQCSLCFVLDGIGFILPPVLLLVWQALPAKRQAPVKVPTVVVLSVRRGLHELEGVEVDGGDVGAHHGRVVLCYPGQQGLQPATETFTWFTFQKVDS